MHTFTLFEKDYCTCQSMHAAIPALLPPRCQLPNWTRWRCRTCLGRQLWLRWLRQWTWTGQWQRRALSRGEVRGRQGVHRHMGTIQQCTHTPFTDQIRPDQARYSQGVSAPLSLPFMPGPCMGHTGCWWRAGASVLDTVDFSKLPDELASLTSKKEAEAAARWVHTATLSCTIACLWNESLQLWVLRPHCAGINSSRSPS
jgi:hypothetical protein